MSKTELDFSLILASAVHDMKNSLGMLMHSVDQLCDQLPDSAEQKYDTNIIRYEAERLNNDLIQLLGVYRLRKNRLSAHLDEHFLEDIFSEQSAQYEKPLLAKGIALSTDCDSSLNWYFDRELVIGVINNAINNASRYTKGKVRVHGEMRTTDTGEYLVLTVNDDGAGYPETLLSIDPSDITNNINFKTGSTSLGLYFASQVAKLHHQGERQGFIKMENGGELGGGLFSLYLP